MAVKLGERLFSIKNLRFCDAQGIKCRFCGKEITGEVGYFVARKSEFYWACVEHGYKDSATNVKGTDAWTLAVMVQDLQTEKETIEGELREMNQ